MSRRPLRRLFAYRHTAQTADSSLMECWHYRRRGDGIRFGLTRDDRATANMLRLAYSASFSQPLVRRIGCSRRRFGGGSIAPGGYDGLSKQGIPCKSTHGGALRPEARHKAGGKEGTAEMPAVFRHMRPFSGICDRIQAYAAVFRRWSRTQPSYRRVFRGRRQLRRLSASPPFFPARHARRCA